MRSAYGVLGLFGELCVARLAVLLLVLWSGMAGAQIYKCEDDRGRPQFSDRPCATDAQTVTVENTSSGINMGSQGNYSGVYKATADRELRRKIKAKKAEIDSLEAAKARALAIIRGEQRYSANNLAGATRDESLATEMDAVVKDYNARIELRARELSELRGLLSR